MALVKLESKAVGSIVKLREYGVPVDYVVVHKGLPSSLYDSSCDGVWLRRVDIESSLKWNDSQNYYHTSNANTYLNGTYLDRFDNSIRTKIKQVRIPYRTPGATSEKVSSGGDGLLVRCFALSAWEVGCSSTRVDLVGKDGAVLDFFKSAENSDRIAALDGAAAVWGLRTTSRQTVESWALKTFVEKNGAIAVQGNATNSYGILPAMILPADLWVTDDGTVTTNTPPTVPSSITVPAQINGGSTVTLSWGTSTDAEDNLEGYKAERSLDGGTTWSQIYQGSGTSATNTVPFGSEGVMYRVKAYDAEGLESGWKTSAQVTVINNTAPTVPGPITVPEAVQGGQPLAVSWGASSDGENNLAGYGLERQVDGGEWAAVYSGPELSFTDAITKGWQTVAYRVRAYDTASAYSGFAASETRQVNNNTPPAITCSTASGTNLGVKSEGFAIPYSVADEEGDAVTVTEAVDGTALRTFTATLGGSNSFQLTGVDFMRLLNGRHTLTVTADDGASSAAHSLSFTKEVTAASITLAQPMEADGPISVCVLAVSGSIPLDADYQVEVTNNALDDEPVWEDCTAAVRAGANYVFTNKTAANGFAFNFRLSVERGPSGVGGHITSVQGGFQ